ncbi:SDR family oxidoreductase [Flavobacterium zepuense]|uniref:SDR family oxidoreductase n=1 Tax=Flavobacterium zepuense TaxID=2593302 RepID=A0A552V887_9FLAO|nr:SDR family oxidoreductase [Flavobacterium zepuense]TRW26660.1 SDR family oxidoreductase [Flavobacterium zepuense]
MKIFVTGATGFVGSAVVQELLKAGHTVLGLARSEASAQKLKAAGAEAHLGDLNDLESIKAGVRAADGVIHLGFIHDFTRFPEVCAIDKTVIETMGGELIGTDKPFIVTSGTAVAANNDVLTEAGRIHSFTNPRTATELAVDAVAAKGVRVAVVRLSPSVHGDEDRHGFVPMLRNIAKEKGKAAIINEGTNVWPAVHRLDAAKLYRLAIEAPFTAGTRFHAVGEEGVPMKDIAGAIAKKLNVPLVSLTPEEAAGYFAWFTHFASLNNPASSVVTQATLGWEPVHPGLLEDLHGDVYFGQDSE